MNEKPKIAILRWEEGRVPMGLLQLENLPGNSTNPASYPFEVRMIHVEGACTETVITNPSQKLLQGMIEIARRLVEEEGIQAITTSCGFNAVFQTELSKAVPVPVFTSALLQIPFIKNLIGDRPIGVLTANGKALTRKHFTACGVDKDTALHVMGLEGAPQWNKIFTNPDEMFEAELVEQEILEEVKQGVENCPNMGAILLECTDLPPFRRKIQEATGLPVFDFSSMMSMVAAALGEVSLVEILTFMGS